MKTSKLILAPVQRYINPLKLKTPADEIGMVTVVFEDEKKEKLVHYEITQGALGEKKEVNELPENIVLSNN
jgi:uncharacterized protein YrrD